MAFHHAVKKSTKHIVMFFEPTFAKIITFALLNVFSIFLFNIYVSYGINSYMLNQGVANEDFFSQQSYFMQVMISILFWPAEIISSFMQPSFYNTLLSYLIVITYYYIIACLLFWLTAVVSNSRPQEEKVDN